MVGARRWMAVIVVWVTSLLPFGCTQASKPPPEDHAELVPPDAGVEPPPPPQPPQDAGVTVVTPPNGLPGVAVPTLDGWQFFGVQQGGPEKVLGVSADEGGNIWVAGGEQGLFLLRPGASTFEHFTMQDGLRPYGFMPEGSAPPGSPDLKAISVAGGPAGTVFVGYEGKPPAPGQRGCEDNWDGPSPDPSIYKSGDADKVTLTSAGISVVHYDIFSGPNVVRDEVRGREKLCTIYRILYDKRHSKLWFGANHGFAMGESGFTGNDTCDGQLSCAGVWEHVHPAVDAWGTITGDVPVLLTGTYRGLALDPASGDIWVGGDTRTTKFRFSTNGGTKNSYWQAQLETEAPAYAWNRIDVIPDAVAEPTWSTPAQRTDDLVTSAVALGDGSVWLGSVYGLFHLSAGGARIGAISGDLVSPNVSALAQDPSNGSLWVGAGFGGGLSRIQSGQIVQLSFATLGQELAELPVSDIQSTGSGGGRKMLVGFTGSESRAGVLGIYSGP